MSEAAAAPGAQPLVSLMLESRAFAGEWGHCDQVANYLAQMVSHDRTDSFQYANLLSTVLNEVMEIIFARHGKAGALECRLSRAGQEDVLEFGIPVGPEEAAFYERSVALALEEGVTERYARSLLTPEPLDHALGLLELVSDYGATLALEPGASGRQLHLRIGVVLDPGHATGTNQTAPRP
jgi:hypothetical protein